MKVRFFALHTTTAGVESVGTLTLKDGAIVADPADEVALTKILSEPLEVYRPDGPRIMVDHHKDPERFLKALSLVYHGAYFWASPVED